MKAIVDIGCVQTLVQADLSLTSHAPIQMIRMHGQLITYPLKCTG